MTSTLPPCNAPIEADSTEVRTGLVAADRDRGCWWIRSNAGLERLTTSEFLETGRFDGYDLLIVESAHVIPRTDPPKSKAQVYTAEELASWSPGCPVRTVRELHAAKRRALYNIDGKADGSDAEAIYRHSVDLLKRGVLRDSTRKFPFTSVPEWLVEIIHDMNTRQNTARVLNYSDDESVAVQPLFEGRVDPLLNILRASKPALDKPSKAKINPAYVMAAYTALYSADGDLRRDPQGRPISTSTVRRLLGMSGGSPRSVARGKLQHDLYGSGLSRRKGHERAAYAQSGEYRYYRRRCEDAILRVVQILRDTQPRFNSPAEAYPLEVEAPKMQIRPQGNSPFEADSVEVELQAYLGSTGPHPNSPIEADPAEVRRPSQLELEIA